MHQQNIEKFQWPFYCRDAPVIVSSSVDKTCPEFKPDVQNSGCSDRSPFKTNKSFLPHMYTARCNYKDSGGAKSPPCECLTPNSSAPGFGSLQTPSYPGAWSKANQKTGYDLKQVGVDSGISPNLKLPKCSLCLPDQGFWGDSESNLLGNINTTPGMDWKSYCSCSNGKNLGCCSGKCHLNPKNGNLYCGRAGWMGSCHRDADCGSGRCGHWSNAQDEDKWNICQL